MNREPDSQFAARIAGGLFVLADVAGVLALILLRHQDDADYFTRAADYRGSIAGGALLVLVMVLAMALIPVVVYPVLRQHSETLALGYVVLRVIESAIVLLGALIPLLVLTTSTTLTDADTRKTLGTALLDQDHWSAPLGDIVWSAGMLALYLVLHGAGMVPRFITLWGFIGIPLCVAGSALALLDAVPTGVSTVGSIVLGLNELALAVWLIVKGFSRSVRRTPLPAAVG
jgi:hypothetical protein